MTETWTLPNQQIHETEPVGEADLTGQLYRAYLAGDGAAVERVMALMAAERPDAAQARRAA